MDFCRVFVVKDGEGNLVERPVTLCHTSKSGELVLPVGAGSVPAAAPKADQKEP
jgi:hypothetical protein